MLELARGLLLGVQLLTVDAVTPPDRAPIPHRSQSRRPATSNSSASWPGTDMTSAACASDTSPATTASFTSDRLSISATVSSWRRTALAVVPRTRAIHSRADASSSSPRTALDRPGQGAGTAHLAHRRRARQDLGQLRARITGNERGIERCHRRAQLVDQRDQPTHSNLHEPTTDRTTDSRPPRKLRAAYRTYVRVHR